MAPAGPPAFPAVGAMPLDSGMFSFFVLQNLGQEWFLSKEM